MSQGDKPRFGEGDPRFDILVRSQDVKPPSNAQRRAEINPRHAGAHPVVDVAGDREPDPTAKAQAFLDNSSFLELANRGEASFSKFIEIVASWPDKMTDAKGRSFDTVTVRHWLKYMAGGRESGGVPLNNFPEAGGLRLAVEEILRQEAIVQKTKQDIAQEAERANEISRAKENLDLVIANFRKQGEFNENEKPRELAQFITALSNCVSAYNKARKKSAEAFVGTVPTSYVIAEIPFVVVRSNEVPGRLWGTRKKEDRIPVTVNVLSQSGSPDGYLVAGFMNDPDTLARAGVTELQAALQLQNQRG